MKIQITNFYKLSIILFILSGCQELEELQFYNQGIFAISASNQKEIKNNNVKDKNFDNNSDSSQLKDFDLNESYKIKNLDNSIETHQMNVENFMYSGLSKLKETKRILETINSDYQQSQGVIRKLNFFKPNINIDFDISKIKYHLALKEKNIFYNNSSLHSKENDGYNYIKLNSLILIRKLELKGLWGYPDFIRKQSDITTFQYRFHNCVIDFFFKEDSEELIFYDVRSRNYNGILSEKDCLLDINLRKIYNH